jgi:hypothetical protein
MKTWETRRYEMLVRVRDFGSNYGDLFPASTLAAKEFAAVAEAVKQLSEYAVEKKSTTRHGVRSREVARQALAAELDTINKTAAAMTADMPDQESKFGVPARLTDAVLLTTGRQFVRDAEPFKSQFILHGMPETFLGDLQALVTAFENALREWDEGKGENAQARTNITLALDAGLAALRKLNVIVPNQLKNDPGLLANWERERQMDWRVRSRRTRKSNAPATTAPQPEPAQPPAPVPVAAPPTAPTPQAVAPLAEPSSQPPAPAEVMGVPS